jgi:hypothetical protein
MPGPVTAAGVKRTTAPASAEGQAAAGPPEQATTETRPVGRITAALWAATLLTALAAVALTLIAWDDLKLSDGISGTVVAGPASGIGQAAGSGWPAGAPAAAGW